MDLSARIILEAVRSDQCYLVRTRVCFLGYSTLFDSCEAWCSLATVSMQTDHPEGKKAKANKGDISIVHFKLKWQRNTVKNHFCRPGSRAI